MKTETPSHQRTCAECRKVVREEWTKRGSHKTCARCGGKYGGIWNTKPTCDCVPYDAAERRRAR